MEIAKKRKPAPPNSEEVANEEEEVKQFFEILQGLQEARDRLINRRTTPSISDHTLEDHKEKKKKVKLGVDQKAMGNEVGGGDLQVSAVWMPSFRREDFIPELREREKPMMISVIDNPSTQKKEEEEAVVAKEDQEVKEEAIDLRLSL